MPITSFDKDLAEATMTLVADYPVPPGRLWDAIADPRQVERFWGPPGEPARFSRHDMFLGGRSEYARGAGGAVAHGRWKVIGLDPGRMVEFRDSFCLPDGSLDPDLPSLLLMLRFEPTDAGSRLRVQMWAAGRRELDRLLQMGMEEGVLEAFGQLDVVLADDASVAAEVPTQARVLGPRQVRIARVLRAPLEDVWHAHHDEGLLVRWQLGPDGWSMPGCLAARDVGDEYRFEWREDATGHSVVSMGRVTEQMPPRREVATEYTGGETLPDGQADGDPQDEAGTVNELTLTPLTTGTLVSVVVTYPDSFTRDALLGAGMVERMEAGYARLERLLDGR